VTLDFSGKIWYWRGPSPFHFVTVPEEQCEELRAIAPTVTYGWGMIPVSADIAGTKWTTSLYPKDGAYLLPVKAAVRGELGLQVGDMIHVRLSVSP